MPVSASWRWLEATSSAIARSRPSRRVAGQAGLQDEIDRVGVGPEPGPEPPLVADEVGLVPLRLQDVAEGVVDADRRLERLAEAPGGDGDEEEVLEVEVRPGVEPAGDHVDHRHRQDGLGELARPDPLAPEPVQVDVELLAPRVRRGVGHRERDAEHRIGPQPALVRRAVQRDQPGVERHLIVQLHPQHRRRDLGRHVRDRLQHPPAAMPVRLAIAQLDRLVPPGARPRRDDRPAHRTPRWRPPPPPRLAGPASRRPRAPRAPTSFAMTRLLIGHFNIYILFYDED